MFVPYDEQQGLAFIADGVKAYQEAGRMPDDNALIWPMRVVYDACVDDAPNGHPAIGWAASRAKHLTELRVALGLPASAPDSGPPPNIKTTDNAQVLVRVQYWVRQATPGWSEDRRGPYYSAWMGYIFDVAGEGHDIGWTADEPNNYWTVKILAGDYT